MCRAPITPAYFLNAASPCRETWVRRFDFLQRIFSFPPLLSRGSDACRCCSRGAARGWEAAQKRSIKKLLPAGGYASGARFALCRGRGTMSFEVVGHEHPNIFVVKDKLTRRTGSPLVRTGFSRTPNRGRTWVKPVGLQLHI